jgi:hypothetical protein
MKLDKGEIIEIYKELGLYERHFNQIQNLFKGLSSTWFLAGFTAIGYLFSTNISSLPININLAASLVCLVVCTGILLFWMMDVLVYHKLLLATIETGENFKSKNSINEFIQLRENWKSYTSGFRVRNAMSIFYLVQCSILVVGATYFIIKVWNKNVWYNNTLIVTWLVLILVSSIAIWKLKKK